MNYYYNLQTDKILSEKELSYYLAHMDRLGEADDHWHFIPVLLSHQAFIDYFDNFEQDWFDKYGEFQRRYN